MTAPATKTIHDFRMLDLCSGLGGASAAMEDRGWEVTTVDIEPKFNPDIMADIRKFKWTGPPLDLIWASPPCDEFSRESMPWCRTGQEPSLELIKAIIRIIEESDPRFWIIENTRGAKKWFYPLLGDPVYVSFPVFLWGHFPPLPDLKLAMGKEKLSSSRAAERAKIPYALSLAVAKSIESSFNWREAHFAT